MKGIPLQGKENERQVCGRYAPTISNTNVSYAASERGQEWQAPSRPQVQDLLVHAEPG